MGEVESLFTGKEDEVVVEEVKEERNRDGVSGGGGGGRGGDVQECVVLSHYRQAAPPSLCLIYSVEGVCGPLVFTMQAVTCEIKRK